MQNTQLGPTGPTGPDTGSCQSSADAGASGERVRRRPAAAGSPPLAGYRWIAPAGPPPPARSRRRRRRRPATVDRLLLAATRLPGLSRLALAGSLHGPDPAGPPPPARRHRPAPAGSPPPARSRRLAATGPQPPTVSCRSAAGPSPATGSRVTSGVAIGAAGSDRGAAGSEWSAGSQQGRRAAAVGSDRGAAGVPPPTRSYGRIGPRLTTRPGAAVP